MEQSQNKVKSEKRKGLSFVSINSAETRSNIITLINQELKANIDGGVEVSLIPKDPVPNISFWIDNAEKRCGFTITRENAKYGWRVDGETNTWVPCSYMVGMGYDKVKFSSQLNSVLFDLLIDNCKKNEYVKTLLNK